MKLLFDENLSPKLSSRLSDLFPNFLHVREVGMKATGDAIVWDYARDNNFDNCLKRCRHACLESGFRKSAESYLASIR